MQALRQSWPGVKVLILKEKLGLTCGCGEPLCKMRTSFELIFVQGLHDALGWVDLMLVAFAGPN